MNVVSDYVRALVRKERNAAAEKNGPLASLHEGYAVLLEEMDEAEDELDAAKARLASLWHRVKLNQLQAAARYVDGLQTSAVLLACEAIQVAAVCQRIRDLVDRQAEDKKQ